MGGVDRFGRGRISAHQAVGYRIVPELDDLGAVPERFGNLAAGGHGRDELDQQGRVQVELEIKRDVALGFRVPKHGRNPASRSDPEGSLVGSGSVKVLPRMALVTDFRKYGQKQRGYPHPSRLRVQIPFNPSRPSFDLVFL
ncbi:predicted protein [Micromonas commoda]|uniref:Uncharacterized protein n=1 Tax=Micromonas commoda (strain RCC299 / NOUM17 / CCMP2709) TaxID=296587 RepID=C1E6Z8_MICCC|nr:predicted protein [Micromonas commoda]ACO63518.1 predicted protein [Micromonas commoda]|eukprot:XP_002502260.1 predicted protein [Micromonas commoda]